MSLKAPEPVQADRLFDLLDLHAFSPERYPHLLQSSADGPQSRYDILFAFPQESLLAEAGDNCFLDRLESCWQENIYRRSNPAGLPFVSGWFIYLGYETAREIEPSLILPDADTALPVALATRIPATVVYDKEKKITWICAESQQQLRAIEEDINQLKKLPFSGNAVVTGRIEEDPEAEYLASVERILSYIVEGDVFQVNLSRQWKTSLQQVSSHAELYALLRSANPGPFNGLATWQDKAIFSSSPERLVSLQGGLVETRPIAGTRPRGKENSHDQALSEELLSHPKERAEHIMLIDLVRNDLGRIAVPGSVKVDELMSLETYSTVHHIVSNVSAQKRHEISPIDVIRAVFPGGTITGCPKVRCMEIIAELEKTGRGPYTGSMGYLGLDGNMDLNILIRTIVREADALSFRAGAGIVADSIARFELSETRSKASGMLRALGVSSE